jgi:hypothetical protein
LISSRSIPAPSRYVKPEPEGIAANRQALSFLKAGGEAVEVRVDRLPEGVMRRTLTKTRSEEVGTSVDDLVDAVVAEAFADSRGRWLVHLSYDELREEIEEHAATLAPGEHFEVNDELVAGIVERLVEARRSRARTGEEQGRTPPRSQPPPGPARRGRPRRRARNGRRADPAPRPARRRAGHARG